MNDGDQIEIRVECRADAGDLDEMVRYALVVTLEVEDSVNVRLYEEIKNRLQPPTPVRINP